MEELMDTVREAVEEASEAEEVVATEEAVAETEVEEPKPKRRGRPKKVKEEAGKETPEKTRTTKIRTKVLTSSEKENE